MVKVFKFKRDLSEKYYEVLWYIDQYGKIYKSEREQLYKEAEPVLIEVYDPILDRPSKVLPQYIVQRWGEKFIIDYAFRVAHCKSEPGMWTYSYGERLGIDNQLDNVVKKMEKNPDTRQATCVLYLPSDTRNPEPPCLCLIDFKIRDNKLMTTGIFRSNDMENAYPSNYYDLLVLSYEIAERLNISVGRITTFSISGHIYI